LNEVLPSGAKAHIHFAAIYGTAPRGYPAVPFQNFYVFRDSFEAKRR